MKQKTNKRKLATTSMAILGVTLVVGGAFAALNDTLNHDETVTIEWVDIVDGSTSNLALEDVSDVNNTPVVELTPGITYELTGTLENDSTVVTDWTAVNLTTTPGMSVNIADTDGDEAPVAVGQDIDVAQFGITVTVDQGVTPSTPLNFAIEFTSTDARVYIPVLDEPTAISEVFIDPALATCVANDDELVTITGGNVNYPVSQEELNGVSTLTCVSSGIVSLEGMQYLTNLTTLDLWDNQISDLEPLKNLNNLTTMSLNSNQITDISPLANLENLETLNLDYNQISDLSPLSNLTNLTELTLISNQISDITPLANLVNLQKLDLGINEVTDLTIVSGLTNLEYFSIAFNQVTDITPIANLTNLTYLNLVENQISDFSSLTYMPTTLFADGNNIVLPDTTFGATTPIIIDGVNGEDLIITFNTPGTYNNGQLTWVNPGLNSLTYTSADGRISGTITQYVNIAPTAISTLFTDPAMAACVASDDESPAGGNINYIITQEELNAITTLNCRSQGINNLNGVQYMINLTELDLAYNSITDITPVANLTNLITLDLGENQISNIEPLKKLTNLEYLSIYENNVTDISALSELINLETFNAGHNQISDLTPLINLTNLTNLYVSGNLIVDLTPLAGLENLTRIDAANNQIENVTALSGLMNLEYLNLDGNQISDFSPLTYQPESFSAKNQYIDLPTGHFQQPTSVVIEGINGQDLTLTSEHSFTYTDGELTWETGNGERTLTFSSADGLITGTVTQWVNMPPL